MPDTEMTAIGGEGGVFAPVADALQPAVTLTGSYEFYLSPRRSVRISGGWTDPGFDSDAKHTLRQIRVAMALLYNWEQGAWHPFVGGGGGAYFLQETQGGRSVGDGRTKGAVSFGGGIEYFSRRTITIKAEALYHIVAKKDVPVDSSGLTLTIGLKRYF